MFRILNSLICIFFLILGPAFAEILKPNENIIPMKVVKIQLDGLKKNDSGYKDQGIEQTWEFAHPNNKIFTGPLERFKEMLKGDSYKMLLNHKDHKINEIFSDENVVMFEVIVMDSEKKYHMFKWQVEKYLKSGPLQNCWLTTMVSAPISLGSSI
mgnify:CR=1 FL=1|tara:strand:+ start:27 stop:491 length:465 start_codon:yes stop_codon:yes gene_type:complete